MSTAVITWNTIVTNLNLSKSALLKNGQTLMLFLVLYETNLL